MAINQIHAGQVKLTSLAGLPITHAQIAVAGDMPQHGYGLPMRPQVAPMAADSERRPIRLAEQEVKEPTLFLGSLSGSIMEASKN